MAAILFSVAAAGANAQDKEPIPDEYLYQAVFRQVRALERFGDQLDAKGANGEKARSSIRRDAQLTVAEDAAVKDIARSFAAADETYHQTQSQLFATLRAPAGRPNAAAASAEFHRLQDGHLAMTREHLARLKAALGPERFAAFNHYARTRIAPQMTFKRFRVK